MSVIRIQKNTLNVDSTWGDSGGVDYVDSPIAMTIDHYAGGTTGASNLLAFTISSFDKQISYLKEIDIVPVVRGKIDITATGPSKQSATNADIDNGSVFPVDKLPKTPKTMPFGFTELKGESK